MKKTNILKGIVKVVTVSAALLFMAVPARAEEVSGIYPNNEGVWSYYSAGVIDTAYTGLAENENGWWYIKNGFVDFTYTGYVNWNGREWCVIGGKVDVNLTDILLWEGQWHRVYNGYWDKDYTGVANNENGWWYVKDGVVDFTYTGMAENENGTWYVKDGFVDLTYTGYVDLDGKEWCVIGGRIDTDLTDVMLWEGQWYRVYNGYWDKEYTGLAENENGTWYVKDGLVDLTYTGYVDLNGKEWCVVGGKIDTDLTSVLYWQGEWYRVYNGYWDKDYTGLAENENGNWYIRDGFVDFTYTGRLEYQGSTYHITDGCVDGVGTFTGVKLVDGKRLYYNEGVRDTSYSGNAKDIDGLLWHVKNGVVDGSIGVDVSSYQGDIDWDKVKADGIQFAVIRIGYGDNIANQDDAKAIRNMDECERIGMPYGVYLYSYAVSEKEAVSEKDHILRMLDGRNPSMGVYLDIEDTAYYQKYGLDPYSTEGKARIMKYISIVMDGISPYYKAGVYANYNYFTNIIDKNQIDEMKWLAIYGRGDCPDGDWDMWQYTSQGSVDGINGHVDMNIWYR